MRRSERASIALGASVFIIMVLFLSFRYLPLFPVKDVQAVGISTPSIEKIILPLKNRYFPSLDLTGVVSDARKLPYISDASITYNKGVLQLETVAEDGFLYLSDGKLSFISGDSVIDADIRDLEALKSFFPVIYSPSGESLPSGGFDSAALSVIAALRELDEEHRDLIDIIESVNNNDGSASLALVLSSLNAGIRIREAVSASNIAYSIDVIRNEKRGLNPHFSEYALYSDRLVRL